MKNIKSFSIMKIHLNSLLSFFDSFIGFVFLLLVLFFGLKLADISNLIPLACLKLLLSEY